MSTGEPGQRSSTEPASTTATGSSWRRRALPRRGPGPGRARVAVTTPANLELIGAALGERAGQVDYAESAFFGRRAAQRVAAFFRYWRTRAAAREGATPRTQPRRWGPGANPGRADLGRAVGPRDRGLDPDGVGTERRARGHQHLDDLPLRCARPRRRHHCRCPVHPPDPDHRGAVEPVGAVRRPGGVRALPRRRPAGRPARRCRRVRVQRRPAGSAPVHRRSRRRIRGGRRPGRHAGPGGQRGRGVPQAPAPGGAAVRTWEQPGAVVCDFRQPGGSIGDPFLGLRRARARARRRGRAVADQPDL